MGFWQKVKKKVKEWVGGGSNNASSQKATPPAARVNYGNRDSRNQTVSSSFNRRSFLDSLKDSGSEQREENRVQRAFKASDYSSKYKSLTDNSESSLLKLDKALKKDVPDPKEAARQKAKTQAEERQKKADALDPKRAAALQSQERAKAYIKDRKDEMAEFHRRTGNKYNAHTGDKEHDKQAAQLIKGGFNSSDIEAENMAVEYHPIAYSATRGALSGVTFGASDLMLSKRKGERGEAEKYYQENKNRKAEIAGEILGSFASFGGTAGATEKAGAKVISKVAPNAAERLAETGIVKGLAKRGVNKAVKKGLVGEASEELIKQVGKEKAKKIVAAVGTDIVQNATTGLIYDLNKASAAHEIGSKEWWKEMRMSAAFNAAVTGGIAGGAILGGNKKIAAETFLNSQRKQAVEEGADAVKNYLWSERGIGAGNKAKNRGRLFGESIDDRLAREARLDRLDAEDALEKVARRNSNDADYVAEVVNRYPDEASRYYDYDGSIEAVNRYYDPDNTAEAAVSRYYDPEASFGKDDYRVSLNRKRKTDVTLPNERAAEAVEPKVDLPPREQDYYVNATYKSGSQKTLKVKATSEEEAIAKVSEQKGIESVSEARSVEDEWNQKRNAILNYIGEGDETAPAVEATAKGTKPAAQNLKPNTEAQPKFEPQSAEDIRAHSGVKHEQKTNKEKSSEFWSSFRTKFVDSLDAFEQENKKFLKSDPERWAINNGAIDKLRRHQSMAARSIGEGQVGWNGQVLKNLDGTDAKSLKAIYDGLDKDREELFETYLLLKHAPDRADAGKPIYAGKFSTREACEEEANRILANNKDFEKRAEELYQYTRNELQNRADAGLIPQEVVDDWFKKYPHYVPTGRAGEFKPDEDIWEVAHELARNGNTIKAGDIKAASEEISGAPIRSIKEQLSEATTRNWRDMSMNNLFNRMFGDKVSAKLAAEADGGLATVLDNTVNLKSNNGKYYAEVFVDGKPQRVEVEKRFYDGIKDLLKNGRVGDAIDFASDVAAVPSYFFKNVVTSWNPIFMVKNGMRDFPEAVINSRYTKEFMESMGLAKSDLYGIEGGGMWTQALRNQGVSQANFVNLEEALTKERSFIGKGFNKFATLQESVETYPRLVEFMATVKGMGYDLNTGLPTKVIDALKKDGYDLSRGIGELSEDALAKVDDLVKGMGYDLNAGVGNVPMEVLDVAAANAADVTVNFGRSGSIGKMLNRGFVPFLNPSIQGFDKFIRNLSQQPSTAKLLGTITKALALGTGVTAVNNLMLDDNPYYQQIAARDKATNIIIACPIKMEDGKVSWVDKDEANVFIKIPKSRFAAAYSLPMVNIGNENKMGWLEMIKVAGDQVAPVNPIESNILSPFVLASRGEQGETWYGTPIVPESLLDKMPSEQYDANTSWFGKTLGKATAGLPEELQISPKKADYILDATTGVIGDFALPMATPSRQGGGGFVNKYITHPMGNVAKRAFSIDAVTQNDLSTRFYGARDKAEKLKNGENGGEAEKEEFDRLNSYTTEIAGLNQAIRHLQDSDRETKQEDIYELQKVRNQLMQDALDGKGAPTSEKMLDAVQKYVGTTYAVESFGSSADKEAMKVYGASKYGKLSDEEMRKAIDADQNFYKGVRAIGTLEDEMTSAGVSSNSGLSKAIALASADADDELFGAYGCTKQGRTESANKMVRARTYFKDGGSTDEYVQLEKARTMGGKLSDEEKDAELENLERQLASGAISEAEYAEKENEIKYNANTSYVGLATSLALANAPERGYRLYDIKDKNIRKGQNLAAMGFTARDVREMKKAMDTNGNGYPSKQEVIDYVANSNVEDKATLFDALYPYQSRYNPFGAVTNYSRAQAAEAGRANGIEQIGSDTADFALNTDEASGSSGYYGRRRGGYRKYGRSGGKSKTTKTPEIKQSNFKASKQTYKSLAESLTPRTKSSSTANYKTASVKGNAASTKSLPKVKSSASAKVTPPTVKFKKYEV